MYKIFLLLGISLLAVFCKKQKLQEVPEIKAASVVAPVGAIASRKSSAGLVDMSKYSINNIKDYKGKTKIDAANLKVLPPSVATIHYTNDFHTIFFSFAADESSANVENTPDYGKWALCNGSKCVEANTGLWMEEMVLPDDMVGEVTLNVYACILPERALTPEVCGPPQSKKLKWEVVTNKQLFALQQDIFQSEQDRQNLALSLVDVAGSYINTLPPGGDPADPTKAYLTFAQNITRDPYLFAAMISSPAGEQVLTLLEAQNSGSASTSASGASTNRAGLNLLDTTTTVTCTCTQFDIFGDCVAEDCQSQTQTQSQSQSQGFGQSQSQSMSKGGAIALLTVGLVVAVVGQYGVFYYGYKFYSNHHAHQTLKNLMGVAQVAQGEVVRVFQHDARWRMAAIGTVLGGLGGGTVAGVVLGGAKNQVVEFAIPPQQHVDQREVQPARTVYVTGDFGLSQGDSVTLSQLKDSTGDRNFGWKMFGSLIVEAVGVSMASVGAVNVQLSDPDPFTALSATFRSQIDAANTTFLNSDNTSIVLYQQRNNLILSINGTHTPAN